MLVSDRILCKYGLCDYCLGRLFSRHLGASSYRLLGKRLRNKREPKKCYICKDIYDYMDKLLEITLARSSGFEFDTFAIGTQIKPSIIDRDDTVRSNFKLVGSDSVKTAITGEISRRFARTTGKTLDVLDPDLTLVVDTKNDTCHARSKDVVIQGRYVKTRRGFPQKQAPCANCTGKGCQTCSFHGIDCFDSIEGKISEMLISKFGCTTIRFTWIGGEDKASLVLGTGRPFFARIQNPAKRNPGLGCRIRMDFVELHGCRVLESLPQMPIRFLSTVKIRISAKDPLDTVALQRLKRALHLPVMIRADSGKYSEKRVSRVRYRKISDRDFILNIDAEGGLPIKRFTEGDNVTPGISQILGTDCKCIVFDFAKICQMATKPQSD